jgi:hypothetical protein
MLKIKNLAVLVLVLGIAGLVIGAAFIGIAIQKNNYVTGALRDQGITLGLTQQQIASGQVVDNAQEVQIAANTIAGHLTKIAPSYAALTKANKTGQFDPTNPTNLDYAQGLNLENSLNLAILSFGVIEEAMITGIALIIIGIAAGVSGLMLFRLGAKQTLTVAARETVINGIPSLES